MNAPILSTAIVLTFVLTIVGFPHRSWAQGAVNATRASSVTFTATAESAPGGNNNVLFGTEGDFLKSPQAADIRKQLGDPAARAVLRTDHKSQIQRQHPEVVEVVGLTPHEYDELIDLRTDWQMDHLDLFYGLDTAVAQPTLARFENMKRREQQLNQQLAELLGEEKYHRYQEYYRTSFVRMEIAELNRGLDAKDVLTGEQKERFLNLLVEERQRPRTRSHATPVLPPNLNDLRDPKKLEELNRQQTLKLNEAALEDLEQSSALLKERAADVLTPAQLSRFEAMEDQKLAGQRRWVENMRERVRPSGEDGS
jgi:hypothetical protein